MRRRERKSGGARARIMRGSVLSHKQSIKQNLRIRGQERQETKTKTNSARAGITHQHMERKWIAARVSKKHLKIKIKTEVQTGNLEMKDYEETYVGGPSPEILEIAQNYDSPNSPEPGTTMTRQRKKKMV